MLLLLDRLVKNKRARFFESLPHLDALYANNKLSEALYALRSLAQDAGEKFHTQNQYPLAYLCPRCMTIGRAEDASSHEIHVDEWDPSKWPNQIARSPDWRKAV
jgi:hypothetical protein